MKKQLIMKITAWLLCLFLPAAFAADEVVYYHLDVLGSPVAATDEAGNILWTEQYKPFGDRIKREDGDTNTTWYTGHSEDADTGLMYFKGRWYDPNVGRFMGIDPVAADPTNLHSFNRYAYANNNPYAYVDPNGESPVDVFFLAVDIAKLAVAINSGVGISQAAGDVAASIIGVAIPLPGVGQGIKAARLAKASGVAKKGPQSLVERGADLVKRNGDKNRVSIRTPNGRTNIDLAGKPHNVNGIDVPTPHVQNFKNNLIPSGPRAGQVGSRSKLGDTRPATVQDLRTVDRFLKSQGR